MPCVQFWFWVGADNRGRLSPKLTSKQSDPVPPYLTPVCSLALYKMAAVLKPALPRFLLLSFLLSTVAAQNVAPDDADPVCSDIPIRNVTFPNEKILLDSQNYRSVFLVGAEGENRTWLTIDYDGGGSTRSGASFVDSVRVLFILVLFVIIYLCSGLKVIKGYNAYIESTFALMGSLEAHLHSRAIG